MPWFDDSHDTDQSEPRGGTYHNDRNPDGSSSGGCVVLIAAALSGAGALAWAIAETVSRLTA